MERSETGKIRMVRKWVGVRVSGRKGLGQGAERIGLRGYFLGGGNEENDL